MKAKRIVCVAVLSVCAAAILYAAGSDAFMGTWKLNEAKSKIAPATAKNSTVVYTADGDNIKVAIDGTDGKGQTFHSDWTGKFDGKDYAVTGDATSDMRSYKLEGARTLVATTKQAGKVTGTARIVLSADGKTRKVTVNGTDASGAKTTSTQVYDKQ
jgi:hypothetical protein